MTKPDEKPTEGDSEVARQWEGPFRKGPEKILFTANGERTLTLAEHIAAYRVKLQAEARQDGWIAGLREAQLRANSTGREHFASDLGVMIERALSDEPPKEKP